MHHNAKEQIMPSPSAIVVSADEDKQRFGKRPKNLEIDKLFRAVIKLEGSDLHLKVGRPPHIRIAGTLRPLNRPANTA